jgi:hypothetical protein
MKKLNLFCLALVAVFAFSAVIVAAASAETTLLAEWLINGAAVTTLTSTINTVEEILLEDLGNKGAVVCLSVVFDGSIGPSGEFETTEVLTLAGLAITLAAPLLCERDATGSACEASATDIEVMPDALPWHGVMYLDSVTGKFLATVITAAEYVVKCLVLGITITDTCSAPGGTLEVLNGTGGVVGKEPEEVTPDGTCSVGGAGEGTIFFFHSLLAPLTGTLTVSSEA